MTESLRLKYKILDTCDKHPGIFGNSYPIRMREQVRKMEYIERKLELEDTLRKISKINETI